MRVSGRRGSRSMQERRRYSGGEGVSFPIIRFQVDLADQLVEIAGQRSEVLECFNSFFCALGTFSGELRDLAGRFRNLAGGGSLLSCGSRDEMNLVFHLPG